MAGQIQTNQPYYGCSNGKQWYWSSKLPTNLGPSPEQNSGYGNFAPASDSFVCGSSFPVW